jgi:hypothetical protein
MTNKLSFGTNNAKFANSVKRATFSIPAGWTCPGARDCLARVDRESYFRQSTSGRLPG